MAKKIVLETIKGRDSVRFGVTHAGPVTEGHKAEILPGESIRLYGTTSRYLGGVITQVPHSITFKIGDTAEYDSYNLSYMGIIVSIAAKTVTIEAHGKRYRLEIFDFDRRNYDFDAGKAFEDNVRTMQTL